METTSESDQDGGITSGEDTSFERSGVESQGRHTDGERQYSDQQLGGQLTGQYSGSSAAAVTSGNESQMQSNYSSFMMPPSYPSMMMQGGGMVSSASAASAGGAASFFSQNSIVKDSDGNAAAGSPLNLQTGSTSDRVRVSGLGGEYTAATAAVLAQAQQRNHASVTPSPALQQPRSSPHPAAGSAYPQPAHQTPGAGGSNLPGYGAMSGGQMVSGQGRFPGEAGSKTDYPPPPKRPLTPYMRYNRQMWEKVKSGNPSMGVCEISAAIGRMWRELGAEEKQRHNDDYTVDKARYDEELKAYLKATGLRSSDLVKAKPKKKPPAASAKRPAASPAPAPAQMQARPVLNANDHHQQQLQQQQQQQQQQMAAHHAQVAANHHPQQLQALMGLPMSAGSLQIGMPVGFQSMAPMLSGFQQMWATAAGQQYPGGLMTAGQLQELYGGMNGIEAPPPAHSQLPSAGGDAQASALYRYPQNFM